MSWQVPRLYVFLATASLTVLTLIAGALVYGLSGAAGGARFGTLASETQPAVTAIASAQGSLVAGEQLTITGSNLAEVTRVTFAGIHSEKLEVVDPDTLVVTVPAALDYQPATVQVHVFAGDKVVPAAVPLSYSYAPSTAVDHQMQYLLTHWNNYNVAEYGDLNPIGGDCANFVSQSLIARGWTMTDDWYNYDAGDSWADSWGHVPSFDEWLRSHPEYGATQLSFDQRDRVKIGDLVVFDWDDNDSLDHIQVVSSIAVVGGVTKIGMVGHNLDTNYRDLDLTLTVDHPDAIGWFWSIP